MQARIVKRSGSAKFNICALEQRMEVAADIVSFAVGLIVRKYAIGMYQWLVINRRNHLTYVILARIESCVSKINISIPHSMRMQRLAVDVRKAGREFGLLMNRKLMWMTLSPLL